MSRNNKKTKNVFDLDTMAMPKLRKTARDTLVGVRKKQAEERHRRVVAEEPPVMPLTAGITDFRDLLDLDQTDPMLQEWNAEKDKADNNEKKTAGGGGATLLGGSGELEKANGSSSSDDSDDDGPVHLVTASKKRKLGAMNIKLAATTAKYDASDSSDDDFELSTLQSKKPKPSPDEDKADSSDDDFVLADMKKKKAVTPKAAPKLENTLTKKPVIKSKASVKAPKAKAADITAVRNTSPDPIEKDEEMPLASNDALATPNLSSEEAEEDSDEPIPGLTLEESHSLKLLYGRVMVAEEDQALGDLDDLILKAEETAAVLDLGGCIREAADMASEASGMVTVAAVDPRKVIPQKLRDSERAWDEYEEREWLFGGGDESRVSTMMNSFKEKREGVLDVDYMGHGELRVTKELPKYLGDTEDLFFTQEELEKSVGLKLCREFPADEFSITVNDKQGDSFTIVVEICGRDALIKRAKAYIQLLVRVKQMRLAPLEATLKNPPSSSATKKMHEARALVQYKRFEKKTQRIKEIEFSDIHARSVWSSMWKMHKNLFGNACNAACRCVTQLDKLTFTVVSDQRKKKAKNREPFEPPKVVGFCSQFAPKFMPLLRKEFPQETNKAIFERLLHMWDQHRKQQRFGTICRDDCSCAEGWSSVFKKGAYSNETKSTSLKLSDVADDPRLNSVARKELLAKRLSGTEPVVRLNRIPFSTSPRQKEYEISFDTRRQLGFFCVTRKREKWEVCKILSVNSLGAARDARLHPESIVTAAAIGNSKEWQAITTHEELKKQYENCKKDGEGNIRIRFINSDVKAGRSRDRDDKLWTSSNAWSGKSKIIVGWAGGAPSPNDPNESRGHHGETNMTTAVSAGARIAPTGPAAALVSAGITGIAGESQTQRLLKQQPVDHEVTRQGTAQPQNRAKQPNRFTEPSSAFEKIIEPQKSQPRHHGSSQPESIFGKKSKKPEAGKQQVSLFRNLSNSLKKPNASLVKWTINNELRYYDPKDMTYEAVSKDPGANNNTKAIQRAAESKNGVSELQRKLLSAISHKSCVDVFDLLKAGAETKPANASTKEIPEAYAKRIRESLKNERGRNPTPAAETKFADAQVKVILIKIFDRARDVMDNCRCLKKWARYEFSIDQVENLVLNAAANPDFDDKFQCAVAIRGELLGKTSWVKLAETISWNEMEAKRFAFHNNVSLPGRSEGNNVLFTLRKVGGPSAHQLDLANEIRPLTDIAKVATGARDDASFTLKVGATELLESASVILTVRKLGRETKKKIDDQRRSCQKELKRLIDDISQFNKDKTREIAGMHELDFNIQHNITPLHSAVYLNDVDLVRRLVEHGADVSVRDRSVSMTPEMLAMSEIMAIKRTASDTQQYEIEKLQKILKYLGFKGTFDDEDIAFSPTDEPDGPLEPLMKSKSGDPTFPHVVQQNKLAGVGMPVDQYGREMHVSDMASSRRRSRDSDEIAPRVAKKARRDSYKKKDLPAMGLEHLTGGILICKYFTSKKGCYRGQKCHFVHLENIDPTNVDLQNKRPSYKRARDLHVKSGVDQQGRTLHTAMYRNMEKNVYLKARGGATVGESTHGLFWYETEDDAVEAIEQVITLWQNRDLMPQNANSRQVSALKFEQPTSPRRESRIAPPPYEAASRRGSDVSVPLPRQEACNRLPSAPSIESLILNPPSQTSGMTDEEREVFHVLFDANLSNTVMKILKTPLKSSDWKVSTLENVKSWSHVSFTRLIAPNFPKQTFQSGEHGPDCLLVDGKWYHKDIRAAKASAVLEFLKFCKKIGILWSLTKMMTNMDVLPFWKNR